MVQSYLRYQDYQFQVSLASGVWRWTTRVDLSTGVVDTQIREILTPFGYLRDSVPLPGEVVQSMAASVEQVLTAYPPQVLLTPTALAFQADEGQGLTEAQRVQITNVGIPGSLLSGNVVVSDSFVTVTPQTISGLAAGESGELLIAVDSTAMVASGSNPYGASVTLDSPAAVGGEQRVTLVVEVRAKAKISVSLPYIDITVVRPIDGAFPSLPLQWFSLANDGPLGSVLNYRITKVVDQSPWLPELFPVEGSLESGEQQTIAVRIAPSADMTPEPDGTPRAYEETLRIFGYSSNMSVDVPVTLRIA